MFFSPRWFSWIFHNKMIIFVAVDFVAWFFCQELITTTEENRRRKMDPNIKSRLIAEALASTLVTRTTWTCCRFLGSPSKICLLPTRNVLILWLWAERKQSTSWQYTPQPSCQMLLVAASWQPVGRRRVTRQERLWSVATKVSAMLSSSHALATLLGETTRHQASFCKVVQICGNTRCLAVQHLALTVKGSGKTSRMQKCRATVNFAGVCGHVPSCIPRD